MDRWLIIINPTAGGGKAKDLQNIIEEKMKEYKIEYEITFTTKPKDGTIIAENSKHNKIIAVGGDGTINEVAKGIINRKYGILGIIPGGTGNDLSKSLDIPLDPTGAIELLIRENIRNIDIGCINQHRFLNIASAGFDGEVVRNTNRVKKIIRGNMAYILGVLITLVSFRRRKVLLEIDGVKYERSLVLVAVGNGQYYGGGMKILPDASMDDGLLHLCLVRNASNLALLGLFPTIFKGNHIKIRKYVELFKAKRVKLISEKGITINFDGEIREGEKEILFNLLSEKLSVICR